ncbi:MAG: CD3324 family protein [Clostridiaceae bacterium]|nr:CD3324 family protein [Clostridiaceae bacterium]
MKYRNASEILPDSLLRELQKYAPGEVLYVPKVSSRQKWGENTGARVFYEQRNDDIRRAFAGGMSIEALSDEYHLSEDTIRKIVYRA